MATIILQGVSRSQVIEGIRRLPSVLSGAMPDPSGAIRGLQEAMALTLLGKVQDNYLIQAQGGSGELGTGPWEPLAPTTLVLRRKDSSAKVIARLEKDLAKLPAYRQRLVRAQYLRAVQVYRADAIGSMSGRQARRAARGILERMKRHITPARYKKLKSELQEQTRGDRAYRLAMAAAHAEILRDTDRGFNSLSPTYKGPDQVLKHEPGAFTIGTNVQYMAYHQSDQPRKLRKDGKPRLPRRQFLPDMATPIPAPWWKAMTDTLGQGLASGVFWKLYLSGIR